VHVNKLISRFRKSPDKLRLKYPEFNEFEVASALKKFFRELPTPLIGDLTKDFLEAVGKLCATLC
jgi:RhoGAP domain